MAARMTPYDVADEGPQTSAPRKRPCLVCEKPCATEGQLCPECADAGHRVTDTEVIVLLTAEDR